MTAATLIWTVVKALITLLPPVIAAVREGRIRAASQQEVLDALLVQFQEQLEEARKAADTADLTDAGELSDPNNRAK